MCYMYFSFKSLQDLVVIALIFVSLHLVENAALHYGVMNSVIDMVENIVEIGENGCYHHSLLYMPTYRKIRGILFYHCPSVCPSVRLHKLIMKT